MSQTYARLLDEIGKLPLFQGVPQGDLGRLIQAAYRKQCQAGGFFFLQDDPAEHMYVLLEGRVKLSQAGPDGGQVLIRVITPVSMFALVAMTEARSYLVTAQAAEESLALFWTRQQLMEFVLRTPQMAQNAMRIMAERLQEIQERFRQVTTERVERRLVYTLFRLAAQAGKQVEEGVLIDLTLTRQDLAEMSGTTLYTASRMLSSWEKQGWVLASRERVIIRNPHGLARILGDEIG
ncbi:MAG: Crp/Fnr family transcriptional regulator [Anaerolineales bacterium]|jgi:CRP-like cAMP-binding protein|nr:Crp/Fnr family transcriptional regulator [Anaerolineales bacterium]